MKKILILSISISLFIIIVGMVALVFATSFNPEDDREIGYEFLNSSGNVVTKSEGEVVHIWNTQDDYFFEKDAGIQLTNHFQDYWTRNIFCIGYYNNDTWNKIKCADELSNFERSIESDDLTVNATLWKDIEYGAYDLRLGVQYHLGLDDQNLSITIYGKNTGIDIPFDLGFAWKITDWEIPDEGGDSIYINNSFYNLNETLDLLFKNMTRIYTEYTINETTGELIENGTFTEPIPKLKGFDSNNFLEINWKGNLSYAVKMYGDGNQSNFYVALLVNARHFNPGQEKSTTFYWIDATETDGTCTGSPTACGSQSSGTCATCGCSWDPADCYGTCGCSGITQSQCSACDCSWDPAGPCSGSCSCSGITEGQCSACSCDWASAYCYGTGDPCANYLGDVDCLRCHCDWNGDCGGTAACSGLSESSCDFCGCLWNPAGPCSGSCSCSGKSESNCGTCPSCSWDPANCYGTCNCVGKSEGNCNTCPSCSWDPAGPCSGTPTVCADHATRTPCEACGCTWDSCHYSGSGDWNIDCADNCVITDNANLPANVINFYGTGTATLLSNITANKLIKVSTCKLITKTNDGNKLAIKLG